MISEGEHKDIQKEQKEVQKEQKIEDFEDYYRRLEQEYLPNDEDTDKTRTVKEKIFSLPQHRRKILLLWVDLGSYSAVARVMKCSAPTVSKYVNKLREEIGI